MILLIKKHRAFLLIMLCLLAIIAGLVWTIVRQDAGFDQQKQRIAELELKGPEVNRMFKDAKSEADAAVKVKDKAEKNVKNADRALKKLDTELKQLTNEINSIDAQKQESVEALVRAAALLAGGNEPDREMLLSELETALTKLGGSMPENEEEGTEK